MAITAHLYYTGKNGSAVRFAKEMIASGIVDKIKSEEGNLKYEYYIQMDIDLLLIHQPSGNYIAGYKLMEKAYKEGKVKAIGLSNFTIEQIREILSICEVKPTVLQTELHPYHQENELKLSFMKTV